MGKQKGDGENRPADSPSVGWFLPDLSVRVCALSLSAEEPMTDESTQDDDEQTDGRAELAAEMLDGLDAGFHYSTLAYNDDGDPIEVTWNYDLVPGQPSRNDDFTDRELSARRRWLAMEYQGDDVEPIEGGCPGCGTPSKIQSEPQDPDLDALECALPESDCRVWMFEPASDGETDG